MSPKYTKFITDTTVFTGLGAFAFTVISDAVFTTLSGYSVSGSSSGLTFLAGTTIYGNFQNVTLASGSIVLYSL